MINLSSSRQTINTPVTSVFLPSAYFVNDVPNVLPPQLEPSKVNTIFKFIQAMKNQQPQTILCPICCGRTVSRSRWLDHLRRSCPVMERFEHQKATSEQLIEACKIWSQVHVDDWESYAMILDMCPSSKSYLIVNCRFNFFTSVTWQPCYRQVDELKQASSSTQWKRFLNLKALSKVQETSLETRLFQHLAAIGFKCHANGFSECHMCLPSGDDSLSSGSCTSHDSDAVEERSESATNLKVSAAKKAALIGKLVGLQAILEHFRTTVGSGDKNSNYMTSSVIQFCQTVFNGKYKGVIAKGTSADTLLLAVDHPDFLINWIVNGATSAQYKRRKMQHLRILFEYLRTNKLKDQLKDGLTRALLKMESYPYNRKLSAASGRQQSDRRSIRSVKSRKEFLSAAQLASMGKQQFDLLAGLSGFLHKCGRHSLQYAFTLVLALITNGPCYREYLNVRFENVSFDKDGGCRMLVPQYKNADRKGRSAQLYVDASFEPFLRSWVTFRQSVETDSPWLWMTGPNTRLTATTFNVQLRKLCTVSFPSFANGTLRGIRWIQSAQIHWQYKQGIVSETEITELARIYDRSLEVWEVNYSFSDTLLCRKPSSPSIIEIVQMKRATEVQDVLQQEDGEGYESEYYDSDQSN